jgi:phosphatidylinositol glycan class B
MHPPAPEGSLTWIARSPSPLAAFTRVCLGVSLVLHATAAIFSVGYHHPDEHFQILEFANAKLGRGAFSDLPWEYSARMRPWFQPGAAYVVAQAMRAAGIESPFVWASVLRLLSALLGWSAVVALCCCVFGWLRSPRVQRFTILALSTIWFLPYLHARPSSESWSSSLFFLGFLPLVLAVQREARQVRPAAAFACGLAMGLAVEARYQAALLVLGALLWCVRYARLSRATWLPLCAGGVLALALGMALDRWGYGEWVLAPVNYVRVNLWQGRASEFGTQPVWAYASWVGLLGPPPLGLLFVLGTLTTWIAKPRFSLTWCTLPFVVVQSLIGHKEPRFLFPIFPAFPVVVAMAWQALETRIATPKTNQAIKVVAVSCAALNVAFLAAVLFLPARRTVVLYSEIYERGVTELYWVDYDPYRMAALRQHYYRSTQLQVIGLASYDEFTRLLGERARPVWLFRGGLGLPPGAAGLERSCRPEWQSLPAWGQREPWYRWARWMGALEGRAAFPTERVSFVPISLYRCEVTARS